MNAIYLQIIIGVLVFFGILIAFFMTIKSDQYDDLEGPSYRILMDDDDERIPGNQPINHKNNATDQSNNKDT